MSQTDTPARGRVSVLLPGLVNFIYQKKDPAEAFPAVNPTFTVASRKTILPNE